jgi:aspartate aminotransferase-like enzyme
MDEFIGKMEAKGYTLYPGKGDLRTKNMFQIANMGEVNEDMCIDLLKVMAETINELTI